MKPKTPRVYQLAQGTTRAYGAISLQFYCGDFFTILVSQPGNAPLHDSARPSLVAAPHSFQLRYSTASLVVDIFFDADEVRAYNALVPLSSPLPYWSINMEQALLRFFDLRYAGPLGDLYLYARTLDLLIEWSRHLLFLRDRVGLSSRLEQGALAARALIASSIDELLSVETVARRVGLAEFELQAAFKSVYGVTVGVYARELRMREAHRLLETTTDTLLAVGLAVGYNDPGNFSVAFKSYFGYSPGWVRGR